jgi:hypothetical protein
MSNPLGYFGNTIKLISDYATLECKDEDILGNVAFIKQGFIAKLHLKNIIRTCFLITNKTKYCILAGLYDHRLSTESDDVCTLAEKHVIKPFETVKFKVPTLTNKSKIQFYTIASRSQDVDYNTYIPTSADEYLPFYLTHGYENLPTPQTTQDNLEFKNFEPVTVDTSDQQQLNLLYHSKF